jgi:AAA domain
MKLSLPRSQEVYVISNRDVQAMKTLDLWIHQRDTEDRLPLFERNALEYPIPKLADINWSTEPEHLIKIAKQRDFAAFKSLQSEAQFTSVFLWLLEKGESELLHQIFNYLVNPVGDTSAWIKPPAVISRMVGFLSFAPYLAIHFPRMGDWRTFPSDIGDVLRQSASSILRAIVLSANEMQELIVPPFRKVLSQVQHMPMSSFFELVELIALTVRSPELALDLLVDCLESEAIRILTERPIVVQLVLRSAIGIVLDHIDEASQSQSHRSDLLGLKFADGDSRSSTLHCRLRIDAPSTGTLMQGDHIRLTAASSPFNSLAEHLYSMDAQVLASEPGVAKFSCLQPPPRFVEDCSWLLDNCGSFITSKTSLDAVHTFTTQLGQCCGVHQQILGLADCQPDLASHSYMARDDLNASQNKAVQSSLCHRMTCLWGPPGTGKTYTIVAILRELLVSESEQRILVSAPTHNAVDNVMRKFLKEHRGKGVYDCPLRVSTDVSLQGVLHAYVLRHVLLTFQPG